MTRNQKIIGLICAVGLCLGVGMLSSTFQPGAWYQQITKPAWTPPGWVFPPVWTALYILMGVALWLVWKQDGGFNKARVPITAFLIQLFLNGLWSLFFFGLENPGLAFIDIVLLWAMILVTMVLFYRRNKTAGFLLLPYFLWVSFASVLNFTIWRMNA